MPPSCQRLITKVQKFMDHRGGLAIMRPETKEPLQEHGSKRKSVKRRKETEKLPSVEGKRKSVQKETLADSVTMTVNVEPVHVLPLLLQSRRRTTMGKLIGKARFLEGAVHPGKAPETVQGSP